MDALENERIGGYYERVHANGTLIEYQVHGQGEPVLLIHLSLVADGLVRPLLRQPELASRHRLIHYHRRGYAGNGPGREPPTVAQQASDAAALLRHLGVRSAHLVGHSYGGLIALQLAIDSPELVHSLALLEPALRMVPSGKASYEQTILPMVNVYRSGDKRKALEIFCDAVFGPKWQTVVEHAVPGGVEQAVRDVDTFMQEQSVIQEWQFGLSEAATISQPLLSMLGLRSRQLMKEGRLLLHSWFPQIEDFDVQTTHLLQMQDPKGVAHGLAAFFSRHPIAHDR